ncbi:HMG box-containing protein [Ceraceosorus bombacis]|uniref:HMG box-containing protein n=1 Tax=Ceraceosorus bombacis TaxID=401625 RepID=A0A0P1BKR6_9BASI|nr:HMG box-containing protein [Ceraceosorus bombacis]
MEGYNNWALGVAPPPPHHSSHHQHHQGHPHAQHPQHAGHQNYALDAGQQEIAQARSAMIESVAHISSSLRAAATQCDSFVKIVAKHHPTSAAAAIANMGNEFLALASSAGAGALAAQTGLNASGVSGQSAAPPATPGPGHGGRRPLSKEEKAEARKLRKANRDPKAPKRPPSAYLLFQNEVRDDMRKRHPELTYAEILSKISEAWKALTDNQRQVYHDKTVEAMARWGVEKKAHAGDASGAPESFGAEYGTGENGYGGDDAAQAASQAVGGMDWSSVPTSALPGEEISSKKRSKEEKQAKKEARKSKMHKV